jgi:hypothetical protein
MVLGHDAQGRISGKSVCDGCRLILSAAVGGVKFSRVLRGIPPVVLGRVNKWVWIVGVVGGVILRVWKVLDRKELRTRVSTESGEIAVRKRVMLQGSTNLRSCQ